jgi:diguanylate cyclase (GGDEF)-like protein
MSAVLFESRADLLKNIDIQWQRLALLVMLTVILSTLGAIGIAKSITQPIKNLVSQVKSITKGRFSGHVAVSGSQELDQLSTEFNDMTEAIISREQQISFQAFHDPLTHLPNRNSLINAIEKRINTKHDFLLIQLCLLRVEEITDTLGYQASDVVINEVASQIVNTELGCDSYHLGGENFVLILNSQDVKTLILSLQKTLEVDCIFENISLHMQYAFGVVLSEQHTYCSASDLLQKSGVAMQRAKKDKTLFQIYDPIFAQNAVERLFLTNSLKHAIEHDELVLHYQPKLSLNTMTISHVEALVRWQHPEKGLIPPDSFISIAEKTGQIDALTRWVTQQAFSDYANWRFNGIETNIAINISAENLLDKSYSDYIIALKKAHNLPENAITLEVTEDAVVADPKRATEILCYLRNNGFKISVDDYGTGYSSLAQLKQLPVQELKIDRSFVQHLAQNEYDKIIVSSTIELAHKMGLSVVAEGVEDETTLNWLQSKGCQLAQGYLISRPLPSKAFIRWIETTDYLIQKRQIQC